MSDSGYWAVHGETSIDAGLVLRAVLKSLLRICFVTLLLCASAYAVLLFVPKVYESRTELLIEPRNNAVLTATGVASSDAYLIDAAAVASQIELIRSRDTIRAAIDQLDLANEPAFEGQGLEQIIATIADGLVVTQERASRLISVAYRAGDPDLAARIANGIALAHVSRRAGQQISDTIETTGWLEDEIGRLRASVSDAERAIAEFRVEHDLFIGANNESLTNQQLSNYSSQITAATERRSAAQSRAQLIRALLESGQSVIGVSDVQSSSVGQQLSQELGRLQGERAQQAATLLPNHPTIRALDAQIAEIDAQITAEGRRIASALEAQAQIEANLAQSLQQELDRIKVTASSDTIEGVTLASLEREASAQRELLNAYLLRFAEATARSEANSALPDVRIVSEAAPPVRPAAPQITMILLAIAIVSIIVQLGIVVFSELLSGRALVERNAPPPVDDPQAAHSADQDVMPVAARGEEDLSPVDNPGATGPLPVVAGQGARPMAATLEVEINAIAAMVVAGIDRVLIITGAHGGVDSQQFAERLTARLIGDGLSVAEIDAASGQQGVEPGLTDLSTEEADFGDVVHRAPEGQFAYVPWGQAAELDRDSDRAATLVAALADIYECVVIVTGEIDEHSSLPMFADLDAQIVVLTPDAGQGEESARDPAAQGLANIKVIVVPHERSEVA